MSEKPTISIVTPTYNRAELLKKCYESLLAQTDFDFEWIVVDDGSTDETENVVRGFSEEKFPIIYVKKTNGGKHTALNASHKYICGDYVLMLDSDDTLTDTAVEQVEAEWKRFADNREIGLITFLKGANADDPNCVADDEGIPVDIMSYRRRIIHSSDCCEIIRTDLFKQYPFPEFDGEKFIAEGALWSRVSFTHKCVFINRVIYICEYLDGGLTKQGKTLRIRNPRGGMFNAEMGMDRKNCFKHRIKSGLLYTCYGFFSRLKPREIVKNCRAGALARICMPFGWMLYKYWKKKYA